MKKHSPEKNKELILNGGKQMTQKRKSRLVLPPWDKDVPGV